MNRGILCAIDFSKASDEALRWSVALARELKADLTILYTYRLNRFHGEVVALKKNIEEEAHRKFETVEKEILQGQGVDYEFKTEVGFVADRVEMHLKKNPVGFVVMDKHMGALNKENFEELVQHIQVPLILVP